MKTCVTWQRFFCPKTANVADDVTVTHFLHDTRYRVLEKRDGDEKLVACDELGWHLNNVQTESELRWLAIRRQRQPQSERLPAALLHR